MGYGHPEGAVLIAEDEPGLVSLYEQYLTDKYRVLVANNGEEALAAVNDSIDAMILDRHMPGISGDEVLSEIRQRGYTCGVVIVSAVEPDADIIDMPFDEYLTKPVDRTTLCEAVERMITRSHEEDQRRQRLRLEAKRRALERSGLQLSEAYQTITDCLDRRGSTGGSDCSSGA